MNSQPINSTQKSSMPESMAFDGPLKKGQTPPAAVQKELMLTSQLKSLDENSTPRDIMKVIATLNDYKNQQGAKKPVVKNCAIGLVVKKNFTTKLLAGLLLNEQGHNYSPESCFKVNFKLLSLAKSNLDLTTFCDDFCNGIKSLFIRESNLSIPLEINLVAEYSKGLSAFIENHKIKEQIQTKLSEKNDTIKLMLSDSINSTQLNDLWTNLIGESGNQ